MYHFGEPTFLIILSPLHCADDEGNNTWPEILKFLFDCAGSGNVELKESALIIFR